MSVPRRDSARTRARILQAARRLFAERDITSVGIRDIASAAGVSHGLVQRYFGTREQMIAEIVRQEVELFSGVAPPLPKGTSPDELESLREHLRAGMHRFQDYARIIARAELAGIDPGSMLERGRPTPATQLAGAIRRLRKVARGDPPPLDPTLVSAYINASLFAFGTMAPWPLAPGARRSGRAAPAVVAQQVGPHLRGASRGARGLARTERPSGMPAEPHRSHERLE